MKLYVYNKISTCIILLATMTISITCANAANITFQFKGVVTSVDSALRRTTTQIPTGFSLGDTFSGTYTFESNYPVIFNGSTFFSYPGVISAMSFDSNTNSAASTATNGNIYLDAEAGENGYYSAVMPQIAGDSIGNYTPESMGLSWSIAFTQYWPNNWPASSYDPSLGPLKFPFYDTSFPLHDPFGGMFPPPNYGGFSFTFSDSTSTATVTGQLYSVSVKHRVTGPFEACCLSKL